MSADPRRELQLLEDDYFGQPVVVQQADLREINRIRAQLGMPLVDARLNEITASPQHVEEATPEPAFTPDHTEAKADYQAYLKKSADLDVHRAYAEQVARATAGHGQTPVRPLATMGANGGPLLCDHCGKPIVLEGGIFHGITADVAWKSNPGADWTSWILGGLVIDIVTNGTLRIYHGYPWQNNNQCCNAASRKHENARAEFKSGKVSEKREKMLAFLEHEFPDMASRERQDLLNTIVNTLYRYDPGIGVNRPNQIKGGTAGTP